MFKTTRKHQQFTVEATTILLAHFYCIYTLPSEDADCQRRRHDIKERFAAQLIRVERLSARRLKKGEPGIWPQRFWEHAIRDEGDYEPHVDYMHYNPVKMQQARCALLSRPTGLIFWGKLFFQRNLCYYAIDKRIRLQEKKLWGIFPALSRVRKGANFGNGRLPICFI
jgi:REP element-mobilizing transposase RayT